MRHRSPQVEILVVCRSGWIEGDSGISASADHPLAYSPLADGSELGNQECDLTLGTNVRSVIGAHPQSAQVKCSEECLNLQREI